MELAKGKGKRSVNPEKHKLGLGAQCLVIKIEYEDTQE